MRKTGDPMSQFMRDNRGIISLTFIDIGLMITTGILLVSLYSLFFSNNFEEENTMENIAKNIITNLQEVENTCFDYTKTIYLKETEYSITISPEYITVYNDIENIKKNIIIQPWIRKNSWINSSELHIFLYNIFGNKGTIEDPIQNRNLVKRYLTEEWNKTYRKFLEEPLIIDISKPIFIEKTYIYYDINNDGIWMKGEEKQGITIIFQI